MLCRLVADGVVVDAARHAAYDGVVPVPVHLAHHLLQDDRHLLLVDDVARGSHVVLAALVEDAGVDCLDGTRKHGEPLVLVGIVGYHVRAVHAGEGLVVGVFKEAAAAYGYGGVHHLQEGFEVAQQPHGQPGTLEVPQYLLVRDVAQGYLVEFVGVHELVEDVRAQHHGLRYAHLYAGVLVEVGVPLQDVVDEGQSAPLAAEAAVADAGEVGVLVEPLPLEYRHHALVLHPAVCHDGIQYYLPVCVHVLQAVPRDVLQELGDGEQGAACQPAAHVVVADVVEQALSGHRHDVVLQVLEVVQPYHLLHRVGVAEDEVAEAEELQHEVPEVEVHLLRVLVYEMCLALACQFLAVALRRVHDEGDVGVVAAYRAEQLEAGFLVLCAALVHGEAAVADDTQRVVRELGIQGPRLVVVACQHYLGPSPHAQCLKARVQGLGRKLQALLQHELVQAWQYAAVEAYAVLHYQYHLHSRAAYVVLQVQAVLNQLDDGQQELGVAQPAEDVLEGGQVLVLHAARDAVAEGR